MIIGKMRTGTTLIQSLLESHHHIISYGEKLHLLAIYFNQDSASLHKVVQHPLGYINAEIYKTYPAHIKAVGFKVVYSQLGLDNVFLREMNTENVTERIRNRRTEFYQFMEANIDLLDARQRFEELLTNLGSNSDIKVIHIKRQNKLDMLVSERLANLTGMWNATSDLPLLETIRLDIEECTHFFERTCELEKNYDTLFQSHNSLNITYEDMIADLNGCLKSVQEFLDVKYQVLSTDLKKQNKRPSSEVVSNYSELNAHFKNTKWSKYFVD